MTTSSDDDLVIAGAKPDTYYEPALIELTNYDRRGVMRWNRTYSLPSDW